MLTWACHLTFNHTQVFPIKQQQNQITLLSLPFPPAYVSLGPSQPKYLKELSILPSLYVQWPLLKPRHCLPSTSAILKAQLSLKLPVISTLFSTMRILHSHLAWPLNSICALKNSLHLEVLSSQLWYKSLFVFFLPTLQIHCLLQGLQVLEKLKALSPLGPLYFSPGHCHGLQISTGMYISSQLCPCLFINNSSDTTSSKLKSVIVFTWLPNS